MKLSPFPLEGFVYFLCELDEIELYYSERDHSELDHNELDHSELDHSELNHSEPTLFYSYVLLEI